MAGCDRSMVGEHIFLQIALLRMSFPATCCVTYKVCECAETARFTRLPQVDRVEFPVEYLLSSVSQGLSPSLSDRNSPSVPQKFNNAAVIMYLFALFPWARWLLASLNIEQDNLWISISLCDRSLYKAIPSSVLTAPLIHFTFWSCTSSSAMCFVKMTASVGSHPPPKLYSPLWKF